MLLKVSLTIESVVFHMIKVQGNTDSLTVNKQEEG
jgi:hypothetical protein